MTKAERLSASRRKKKADPGQQAKSGAAKPTYVSTDKKKKMKEEYLDERLGGKGVSKKAAAGSIYPGKKGDGDFSDSDRGSGNKAKRRAGQPIKKKSPTYQAYVMNKAGISETIKRDEYGDPIGGPKISKKQLKKNLSTYEGDKKIVRSEEVLPEGKDKKSKGSGTKDACYHKVKSVSYTHLTLPTNREV